MEKRNIVALMVVLVVVVLIIWFVMPSLGINIGPTLDVKVTTNIACGIGTQFPFTNNCWWDEGATITANFANNLNILPYSRPMSFYCGWGSQGQVVVTVDLIVDTPKGTENTYSNSYHTCQVATTPLYFGVPLNSGVGTYQIKAHVCGEAYWGPVCHDFTTSYNYLGTSNG